MKKGAVTKGERAEPWSSTISLHVMPEDEWRERLSEIMKSGDREARRMHDAGHTVGAVEILAPRVVHTDSVQMRAVTIPLDWRVSTRKDMLELGRDLLTKAHQIGSDDPALPAVLASIIEGSGLYAYGIGEFFELYGKFLQKYGLKMGRDIETKMRELIGEDEQYLKPYTDRGQEKRYPLPYAVRNILAHLGENPNRLENDGSDIRTSIALLQSWIG